MSIHKTSRGFTMIELMIVVAIIGILAAVAYPSYRDSVRKARRGEGRAALMSAIQAEERYYSANNAYATGANFTTANGFSPSSSPSSATPAYNLLATGTTTVTITATATQSDPLCSTMTITSAGTKTPAACW